MKTKNFLFTAVLTFGAILFATNVSAQEVTFGTTEITAGTGTVGNVELVLKLQDFQELNVNAATSKVEFTFDSKDDYRNTELKPAVAKATDQLTVFSTKKFNINVKATQFKNLTENLPLDVLKYFTVQATNNASTDASTDVLGSKVILFNTTETAVNLFAESQSKTKNAAGYTIDIEYSLTDPSAILNTIGDLTTETAYGTEDVYTSTVTYTIFPG